MNHPTDLTTLDTETEELNHLDLSLAVDPNEVAFAEASLEHLPVLVSFHETRKVEVMREDTGHWWRRAGTVVVSWEEGSRERFRIWLWQGATERDLAWLQRRVSEAREGRFGERHGWVAHQKGASYSFSWMRPVTADDQNAPVLQECIVPGCLENLHARFGDDEPMHVAERSDDGRVQVIRFEAAWRVWVSSSDDLELTPDETVSFANDLRWAAATARRLNTSLATRPLAPAGVSSVSSL